MLIAFLSALLANIRAESVAVVESGCAVNLVHPRAVDLCRRRRSSHALSLRISRSPAARRADRHPIIFRSFLSWACSFGGRRFDRTLTPPLSYL